MQSTRNLEQADLANQFEYVRETGELRWRYTPPECFSSEAECRAWNAKYAGKEAVWSSDRACGNGWLVAYGRSRRSDHVVWFLHTGVWPSPYEHLRHLNGDRGDDRIENLALEPIHWSLRTLENLAAEIAEFV